MLSRKPWLPLILLRLPALSQPVNPDPLLSRSEIAEIQVFEKKMGFQETKNFRTESARQHAYFLCYSTGLLQLPDSYEGLRLTPATEAGCRINGRKRDLFFYSVEALAGKARITPSLIEASDERKAVVVVHEDFHSMMREAPAPIAEAATTLVGFLTAAEFARDRFGEGSDLHRNLSQEAELFLRKADLVRAYHSRLRLLYTSVRQGGMSAAAALGAKQQIFEELGRSCREISPEPRSFNRCPPVLNNAGLAFDMTYADYYPLVYQMYLAQDRNLKQTVERLKQLATNRASGLRNSLQEPTRQPEPRP